MDDARGYTPPTLIHGFHCVMFQELPIFKFEDVHELVKQSLELVSRVDPKNEHLEAVQDVFAERLVFWFEGQAVVLIDLPHRSESTDPPSPYDCITREALLAPSDGKLLSSSTDHVIAHQDEFEQHHYKNEATTPPSLEVVKRIMLELENLKDFLRGMDDGQIFVVFSEATCLLWKVLMIPSSGTPYYGGCFEFHLALPPDYPAKPPKCTFMTTGGNQVRESGKSGDERRGGCDLILCYSVCSITCVLMASSCRSSDSGKSRANEKTMDEALILMYRMTRL